MEKLLTELERYEELKKVRTLLYAVKLETEFKDRLFRVIDMCMIGMMNLKSMGNDNLQREKLTAQVGIGLKDCNKQQLIDRIGLMGHDFLKSFRQCEHVKLLVDADETDWRALQLAVNKLHDMMNPEKKIPVSNG